MLAFRAGDRQRRFPGGELAVGGLVAAVERSPLAGALFPQLALAALGALDAGGLGLDVEAIGEAAAADERRLTICVEANDW